MNRPPIKKREFRNSSPASTNENYKKMKESKVYGLNACKAFFKSRPQKIIRAFFLAHITAQFPETLSYLATQKKVYRILPPEEMEKVAQTTHHEGVVFIVEPTHPLNVENWLERWKSTTDCLIILENVGNPHNLGAIMRTCAHFGVTAICSQDAQALESGAALRTAEGGAESVITLQYQNIDTLVLALKKHGYKMISTSSHNGENLYRTQLPKKCAFLFGEEAKGLTESAFHAADLNIQIPGTNNVESLNVATSVALISSEFYRQNKL